MSGQIAYLAQAIETALIGEAMQEWESGSKADALTKLIKVTEDFPLCIEAHKSLADQFAVFMQASNDPEQRNELAPTERRYRFIAE